MRLLLIMLLFTVIVRGGKSLAPVVVIGATGRVGRQVVKQLVSQGVETRCLVRDEEKAQMQDCLHGAMLFKGDVTDLSSLMAVTEGAGAVIDCHGVNPPRLTKVTDLFTHPRHLLDSPYTINFLGTKRVIAAMSMNGVGKLVRVTGALTGRSAFLLPVAIFNLLLSMTCKWHERSEIAIRESGIDYTVIRPTGIRDELPARESGRCLVLIAGDSDETAKLPGKISLRDVAELCVASLKEARLSKATVVVSSAEGEGHSDWTPLIAHATSDQWPLKRRWHELPVGLLSLTLMAMASLASRAVAILSSAALRTIRARFT